MILPICFTLLASFTQEQEPPKPAENTICPVMGQKVTEKSPTVTVRGLIYRICCPPCAKKLEKDPDKYLNEDGTLKKKK
jgi:YHS domain-containing protein